MAPRTDTRKTCVERDDHSCVGGGGVKVYDHLMSTKILTWIMNKIFIWICLPSCTNRQFFLYPRRSRLVGKSDHLTPMI